MLDFNRIALLPSWKPSSRAYKLHPKVYAAYNPTLHSTSRTLNPTPVTMKSSTVEVRVEPTEDLAKGELGIVATSKLVAWRILRL